MSSKPLPNVSCPNKECPLHGQFGKDNIIRHSFIRLRRGRRRRYFCKACGQTFRSSTGTPYHKLQHSRKTFDFVWIAFEYMPFADARDCWRRVA